MKGSAQKVRLVADLVRGKKVNDAVAILRHAKKVAARDILKTLRSAVANAEANPDPAERDYLNQTPTSFVLSGEQVDRLRAAAGAAMRGSPEFARLLHDLASAAPAAK